MGVFYFIRGDCVRTSEIFGISQEMNPYSYIDRASLDKKLARLLRRNTHIALKGASKSGKSWLRQKVLTEANVVQCRFGYEVEDVFSQALGNLGVRIESDCEETRTLTGNVDVSGELGNKIIAKLEGTAGIAIETSTTTRTVNLSCKIDNLRFIADIINASERRLVIEDFHYLNIEQRTRLAFDLKTLWDYGCFVVIVGVWAQSNLLTSLNPDLSGRIEEMSVFWNEADLLAVVRQGCQYLNIGIDPNIEQQMVLDAYGNVGILQTLLLRYIEDECDIEETQPFKSYQTDPKCYENAAKDYATQLDGLYQQLAKTLSRGIRRRITSTGIYAIALKIIMASTDEQLQNGLSRDDIFVLANKQEPRIKKGNLKTVLQKIEEIQVDDGIRNLVLSYDESTDSVYATDRQLLFYRKYLTVNWPWESMLEEAQQLSWFEDSEDTEENVVRI